jgi:hypothetical protein
LDPRRACLGAASFTLKTTAYPIPTILGVDENRSQDFLDSVQVSAGDDDNARTARRPRIISCSLSSIERQPRLMDDLWRSEGYEIGDGWAVHRDGVFEVVPEDEVRAMLLVEAPAHRRKGRMRLNADAVVTKFDTRLSVASCLC